MHCPLCPQTAANLTGEPVVAIRWGGIIEIFFPEMIGGG